MKLLHELESDEYWEKFDWVMREPDFRASPYMQPIFEDREQYYDESCESEIEAYGCCGCL